MSYLLYYADNQDAKAAVEWLKKQEMGEIHGVRHHDIIELYVDKLTEEQLSEIRQVTGFRSSVDDSVVRQ